MLNKYRLQSCTDVQLDDDFIKLFEEMLSMQTGSYADAARILFYSDKPAKTLIAENDLKNVGTKVLNYYREYIFLLRQCGNCSLFTLPKNYIRALVNAGIHSVDELKVVIDKCDGYIPPIRGLGNKSEDILLELVGYFGRDKAAPFVVRRVSDDKIWQSTCKWGTFVVKIPSYAQLVKCIGYCYERGIDIKVNHG